ncbi:hypothetical protein GGR16_000150 [Chelatococcus caeni]|uniref:Uncharacterized protein n=1 Tax=Chelatococcus caeni TaxID=1348468 RepID=A0A840BR13_9HYPH|nr:hypothetical protein [Chelatococcus caeni]MBB4015144.1 hypothetical protein [Chelatococcus caeni]
MMASFWSRWVVSLAFGLLVARTGYGVVALPLTSAHDIDDSAAGGIRVEIVSVLTLLLLAAAVTVVLARLGNTMRRFGWGCLLLGAAVLANTAFALLGSEVSLLQILDPATRAENDPVAAFWFWIMIMGVPSTMVGLLLLIGGLVLLRKAPRPVRTGG